MDFANVVLSALETSFFRDSRVNVASFSRVLFLLNGTRHFVTVFFKVCCSENRTRVCIQKDPVHPKGASPDDVITDYITILRDCDLIIVILGERYSYHVENEFNYAIRNGIDCLLFIKNCEKEEQLDKKIKQLYSDSRLITYERFEDLRELETQIKESIMSLLSKRFRSGKKVEKAVLKLISKGDIKLPAKSITPGPYLHGVSRISPYEIDG